VKSMFSAVKDVLSDTKKREEVSDLLRAFFGQQVFEGFFVLHFF